MGHCYRIVIGRQKSGERFMKTKKVQFRVGWEEWLALVQGARSERCNPSEYMRRVLFKGAGIPVEQAKREMGRPMKGKD